MSFIFENPVLKNLPSETLILGIKSDAVKIPILNSDGSFKEYSQNYVFPFSVVMRNCNNLIIIYK
jgi:hypothetical protein